MRALLLLLIVGLDVAVVTPWLVTWASPAAGVEAAWAWLIPIAASVIGGMINKNKNKSPQTGPTVIGSPSGGGGMNWGAAAPWLAGAAGLGAGALLGRDGGSRSSASSPLDELLAMQTARYQQNEPLQQALVSAYAGMLPTYLKQPGGGVAQWQQGYDERSRAAQAAQRRVPVSGVGAVPRRGY